MTRTSLPNAIEISPVTNSSEVAELQPMLESIMRHNLSGVIYSDAITNTLADVEKSIGDDTSTYFIARIGGKAVGFTGIQEPVPATLTYQHWHNPAEIPHLYVAPAYQSRGIGTRLVDQAAAAASRRLHGELIVYDGAWRRWATSKTSLQHHFLDKVFEETAVTNPQGRYGERIVWRKKLD